MSLRRRAIAYLVVLHLIFAALAVYLFLHSRFWLIAIEAVFVVSSNPTAIGRLGFTIGL